jgi:mannose-6-phosphate isomerase-like protein (cupin superfamily)
MSRLVMLSIVFASAAFATPSTGQTPQAAPPPTDRTKATVFSAADLAAGLARLPADRAAASVRVFSLAPYNVNVERRLAKPQGASLHEAQAELFYVIEGAATLLTGGALVAPVRTGSNLAGTGIEGGTRQAFGKGDFLMVPSGVAHQFVDIQSPVQLMAIYLPNAQ